MKMVKIQLNFNIKNSIRAIFAKKTCHNIYQVRSIRSRELSIPFSIPPRTEFTHKQNKNLFHALSTYGYNERYNCSSEANDTPFSFPRKKDGLCSVDFQSSASISAQQQWHTQWSFADFPSIAITSGIEQQHAQ